MPAKPSEPRTPSPIDQHVGRAIRTRRRILGVSQEKLAGQLGLTFQQVQKYERGSNRVSASKLWEIAHALDCRPQDFFPESDAASGEPIATDDPIATLAMEPLGLRWAGAFLDMPASARSGMLRVAEAAAALSPYTADGMFRRDADVAAMAPPAPRL